MDEMLSFAEQANREYEAELYGQQTVPEKLTVLVVYPFDVPVGMVLNDECKLIGLNLNRSLRDEHGEIYDIVAGTFLVVGLGPESFASLPPDMIQKYTGQFKRPELFASINGQIVSVPVEPEKPAAHGGNDPGGRLRDDRRDHQQRPPWGGTEDSLGRGAQDHAGQKALHPGAAGGRETGVRRTERPGQACPAEEAPRSWATYEPE